MSRTNNKRLMKQFKKEMTNHLRMLAKHHISGARTVLNEGMWFEGRSDSHDYDITNAWRKARRPKSKECYYNAQMFCVDHREGRYFEGYALWSGFVVPHAWVVMPDGKVIDFTWEAAEHKLRDNSSASIYFGVEVPLLEVSKMIGQTGMSWSVLAWLDTQTKSRSNNKSRRKMAV